jgi:toxin ParE1/3/4
MRYRLLPEAEADLDGIWLYVAKASGSMDIADPQLDAIVEALALLSRHPLIGRSWGALNRPGIRRFPVGSYMVAYRPEPGEVVILRILPAAPDLDALPL